VGRRTIVKMVGLTPLVVLPLFSLWMDVAR
jgi:hypothetical protein